MCSRQMKRKVLFAEAEGRANQIHARFSRMLKANKLQEKYNMKKNNWSQLLFTDSILNTHTTNMAMAHNCSVKSVGAKDTHCEGVLDQIWSQ